MKMQNTYTDDTIAFAPPRSCTEIVRFNRVTWNLSCGAVQISLSVLPREDGEFILAGLEGAPTVEGYRIAQRETFDFGGCTGASIASTREVFGRFHSQQIQAFVPKDKLCLMLTLSASKEFSFGEFEDFVKTIEISAEALESEGS